VTARAVIGVKTGVRVMGKQCHPGATHASIVAAGRPRGVGCKLNRPLPIATVLKRRALPDSEQITNRTSTSLRFERASSVGSIIDANGVSVRRYSRPRWLQYD